MEKHVKIKKDVMYILVPAWPMQSSFQGGIFNFTPHNMSLTRFISHLQIWFYSLLFVDISNENVSFKLLGKG